METVTASSVLISIVCIAVFSGLIKVVNWVWLRPKKLERWFKQQGLPGTSYQFLFGDMKEYFSMRTRALEKPMNSFTNDYVGRVDPFGYQNTMKFGKECMFWAGPTPMVCISKPELIREAFTKIHEFRLTSFSQD